MHLEAPGTLERLARDRHRLPLTSSNVAPASQPGIASACSMTSQIYASQTSVPSQIESTVRYLPMPLIGVRARPSRALSATRMRLMMRHQRVANAHICACDSRSSARSRARSRRARIARTQCACIARQLLDGLAAARAIRRCSSSGGRANSYLGEVCPVDRRRQRPDRDVSTACSMNASVCMMNGSNSGSTTFGLGLEAHRCRRSRRRRSRRRPPCADRPGACRRGPARLGTRMVNVASTSVDVTPPANRQESPGRGAQAQRSARSHRLAGLSTRSLTMAHHVAERDASSSRFLTPPQASLASSATTPSSMSTSASICCQNSRPLASNAAQAACRSRPIPVARCRSPAGLT